MSLLGLFNPLKLTWRPKLPTYALWSIASRTIVRFRIVRWHASMSLEGGALWWLRELLVLGQSHVSAEFNQDRLHCEFPSPLRQTRQLGCIDLCCMSSCLVTILSSYLSVLPVHARQVDLGCELDLWRVIRVVWAAMKRNAVDAVLMNALCTKKSACSRGVWCGILTWGGPRIVPFQSDINRSSPLSRPYEQASVYSQHLSRIQLQLSAIPAPRPFSPFSSSSSRRKLRGTLAPMFVGVWSCVGGVRKLDACLPRY